MQFSSMASLASCRKLGLLIVFGLLVGCGGAEKPKPGRERVSASGKVTFDGAPVPAGFVVFNHNESGTPVSCPISDGAYESVSGEGPIVGANMVTVTALDKAEGGQALFGGMTAKEVTVEAGGYTGDFAFTKEEVTPAAKNEVDEELGNQ
ncbi:MAG: hypothetical protein ACK50J_24635 [Planctomyces sp.]